jgi:hypothetical protein
MTEYRMQKLFLLNQMIQAYDYGYQGFMQNKNYYKVDGVIYDRSKMIKDHKELLDDFLSEYVVSKTSKED